MVEGNIRRAGITAALPRRLDNLYRYGLSTEIKTYGELL